MNSKPIEFNDLNLTPAQKETLAAGARQFVDPQEDPRDAERYDEVVDAPAE